MVAFWLGIKAITRGKQEAASGHEAAWQERHRYGDANKKGATKSRWTPTWSEWNKRGVEWIQLHGGEEDNTQTEQPISLGNILRWIHQRPWIGSSGRGDTERPGQLET